MDHKRTIEQVQLGNEEVTMWNAIEHSDVNGSSRNESMQANEAVYEPPSAELLRLRGGRLKWLRPSKLCANWLMTLRHPVRQMFAQMDVGLRS